MSTIYLIRHGQIPPSLPKRFVGRSDFELTQHGREQIAVLAAYLEFVEIEKNYLQSAASMSPEQ